MAILSSYAAWSDDDLLVALRTDDRRAFAEVFRRHAPRLLAAACGKLQSREAAEELVQELFETLWTSRAERTIGQLAPYLLSALKYRVINHIRARDVRRGYAVYCRVHQTEAVATTEEAVALDDLRTALLRGMQQLPALSREVFRLSRLEQRTVPEIAQHVNLSPKAVEYHLTRSLKWLRLYLRDFLVALLPLLWLLG